MTNESKEKESKIDADLSSIMVGSLVGVVVPSFEAGSGLPTITSRCQIRIKKSRSHYHCRRHHHGCNAVSNTGTRLQFWRQVQCVPIQMG